MHAKHARTGCLEQDALGALYGIPRCAEELNAFLGWKAKNLGQERLFRHTPISAGNPHVAAMLVWDAHRTTPPYPTRVTCPPVWYHILC